jgi:hypothetical protein
LQIREAIRNEVIVPPCLPPYLLVSKRPLGLVAISDKCDSYEVDRVSLETEPTTDSCARDRMP